MASSEFASPTNQSYPPEVIAHIHEMADTGRYPIRGLGARRKVPTFDDLVFLDCFRSAALPIGGLPRERCERRARSWVDGTVLVRFRTRHPDHNRRYELRRPVSDGEGGSQPCRHCGRHIDHDGRRRHDTRGAQSFSAARIPGAPFPFRIRSGGSPTGRRRRDRGRAGGETRRRRNAARAEGERSGGGHADAPRRHRPALGQSPRPDWVGPDDLRIKIEELREATEWSIPIYVKVGATRVDHDVEVSWWPLEPMSSWSTACKEGTAATQDVFIEHAGFRPCPLSAWRRRRAGGDPDEPARCSWSSRVASDRGRTWPRRWPWAPTPSPSGWLPCSPWAATGTSTAVPMAEARRRDGGLRGPGHHPGAVCALPYRLLSGRHHHPGSRFRTPVGHRDGSRDGGQLSEYHHGSHGPGPGVREIQASITSSPRIWSH